MLYFVSKDTHGLNKKRTFNQEYQHYKVIIVLKILVMRCMLFKKKWLIH
jgi:hypothetical protein